MLNSKHLLRIASLLRLFAWLLDKLTPEIDNLVKRCEREAELAKQGEVETPEWLKGAPWNDTK